MEYWEYSYIEEYYSSSKKNTTLYVFLPVDPYVEDISTFVFRQYCDILGYAGWELVNVVEHHEDAYELRRAYFKRKCFRQL